MIGHEVIASLHEQAIRTIEAKAKLLRNDIEHHGGDDPDAECRLEIIERILRRIYEHSPPGSAEP